MSALDRSSTVAVVGAGTMGQGIAQVALLAGHRVKLHDAVPGRARAAVETLAGRLDRLVAKERLSAADRGAALARLAAAGDIEELSDARLVVEAVIEDLAAKRRLLAELEAVVGDECLLATNTSSLSVTAVAGALRLPGRLVGLHFFNPAPVLPLVEVVAGAASDPAAVTTAYDTAAAWGKAPVRCTDTPGFLVNRVARPFYAEALRIHEERAADPATVDALLRECGGFAMGPFALMDLIGQDVNEAVTRSVWDAFNHDPKFTPSLAQRRLVESGRLGRKSGRGWFAYDADTAALSGPRTAEPAAAPPFVTVRGDLGPARELVALAQESGIEVREEPYPASGQAGRPRGDGRPRRGVVVLPSGTPLRLADGRLPGEAAVCFDLALDYRAATRIGIAPSAGVHQDGLEQAVGFFQAMGKAVSVIGDVPGMVVARTVAMLVDFAVDAVAREVASAHDVDTAMRLGVNYPLGPLEWGERLTAPWVRDLLDGLHSWYPTGRYAPCPELRRRAAAAEGVVSS
ncbi:3-hydroxyacyl-CoA dehydrogenase [Streptomyces sp. DvalAA-14]|uniref:3-hydroxyacyl-CoA dehydrogenase n=1 Tax=unclassified Streptomyces TaxID=2593676 RepID=UPI00081B989B|nr:3-hydroxyacyl-CoA dehydrogenase [Streptomyces sp. DvalAA-14]MYS18784.1 3-hydroxyacyl-CoA dehydrogenase [Streptomyces sp. SID4948]SCD29365.1 3-hydroxyacyl-CoA dehydrogenase [Streptomyces sp. DvalAA-14]